MDRPDPALDRALATLRSRWGTASIRVGGGTVDQAPSGPAGSPVTAGEADPAPIHGALALVPAPVPAPDPSGALRAGIVPTGFPALDAILSRGGLPAEASASLRGDLSSGKTTLALRWLAAAQACGSIAAWVDLGRTFDPVEAVARGVGLERLVVLRPADVAEGFAMAGALLSGRAVDLLVLDLPARLPARTDGSIRRLTAHVRRVGARLIVLEPAAIPAPVHGALAEGAGLRLELERRGWLRLGRDIVGQRSHVVVLRDRHGAPGRTTDLEIHYLTDGERAIAAHRFATDRSTVTGRAPRARATPSSGIPHLRVAR